MLTQQFGKPAVRCTLMLLFRMINNCLFKVMNNIKLVIVNNFMYIIFVFIFNVNLLFYGVGHDLCFENVNSYFPYTITVFLKPFEKFAVLKKIESYKKGEHYFVYLKFCS